MSSDDKFDKLYQDQLNFVKELYSTTKEESRSVLKKADDVLNRVGKTEADLRSIVRKATSLILGLLVFFGSILGFFGIKTWIDVTKRYHEFKSFSEQSKEYFQELVNIKESADKIITDLNNLREKSKELREINLEIRRLADDLEVSDEINKLVDNSKVSDKIDEVLFSELADVSLRFRMTRGDIWRYIENLRGTNYLVLFEAIKQFSILIDRGEIELTENEIKTLIQSSISVLKNCNEYDWRTQLRCREFIIGKIKSFSAISSDLYESQIKTLRHKIVDARNYSGYKWSLVIILSKLGLMQPEDQEYLNSYIDKINSKDSRINEPGRTWISCVSAIELLKYNQEKAWNYFIHCLKHGTPRQKEIATVILSNLGRKALDDMDIENNLRISDNHNIYDFLIKKLTEMKERARDKYSQKYYDLLIRNLSVL